MAPVGNDAVHFKGSCSYAGRRVVVGPKNTSISFLHQHPCALCSRSITWPGGIFTFELETRCIDAPVYSWIFCALTGTRLQMPQCVQRHSAQTCWCPKGELSDPNVVYPFRNTDDVRDCVVKERKRLMQRDGQPRDHCKEKVCCTYAMAYTKNTC